jgi:hypothetical protein
MKYCKPSFTPLGLAAQLIQGDKEQGNVDSPDLGTINAYQADE